MSTVTSFNAFRRLMGERCGQTLASRVAFARLAAFPLQPSGDDTLDVRHTGAVLMCAAFGLSAWTDLSLREVEMRMGEDVMRLCPGQASATPLLQGWLGTTASYTCAMPVVAGFDPGQASAIGPTYGDFIFAEADHPAVGREIEVVASFSLSAADGPVLVTAHYGAEAASRPVSRITRIAGPTLVKVGQGLRGQRPEESPEPDPELLASILEHMPPLGGMQ